MARNGLRVNGTGKLLAQLKRNVTMKEVKVVVKSNTAELQAEMQRKASFKGHMQGNKFIAPTGATKRSISLRFEDGGLTGVVAPQTNYSAYLEYGTRKMTAQPFVSPAYFIQRKKFLDDLNRLMK